MNFLIKSPSTLASSTKVRISQTREMGGIQYTFREAESADAVGISDLFERAYGGKYLSDTSAIAINNEITAPDNYIWLITTIKGGSAPIGCLLVKIDRGNKIAKISNVVVLPGYTRNTARRHLQQQSLQHPGTVNRQKIERRSLGSIMLELVVDYMTNQHPIVDVVYGTTRTINAAPARLGRGVGFRHAGIFPNAVWIKGFEHLNLEVFVTPHALRARRKCTQIFLPLAPIYSLAAETFALETPEFTQECALVNGSNAIPTLTLSQDQIEVSQRYKSCRKRECLGVQFAPFLYPNCMLSADNGKGEIFVNYNMGNKQAMIVGYWSDQEDAGPMLEVAAHTLNGLGAAYIEMLVSAHAYLQQQQAYAAHYLPCAYLPAAYLAKDGLRDDYFIFSRTFQPLDFEQCVISNENAHFLRAYLKLYQEHPISYIGASTGEEALP